MSELDFSNQILAKKRSGPKSGAQTPAKPSEKKKGSSKNKPGSAGEKGSKITFSEKVITSLKNKVKEHNEKHSKKVTLSQLKKVYRRGAGAFSSSHRPGKTRGQWAMARVNMFLKMMRGGKVKDSYRAADQDIAKAFEVCIEDANSFLPTVENLIEAKLELQKLGIEDNLDDEFYNFLDDPSFEQDDYSEAAQEYFGGKKRADLKDSDFLFPENRSFPIVTPQDVPDAISNFGRRAGKMSYNAFLRRLVKFLKKKGKRFMDALPEATKDKIEEIHAAKDPMKHAFKTKKEAEDEAKKMGLKGTHSHKNKDGEMIYMPGETHEAFLKRHEEILKEKK